MFRSFLNHFAQWVRNPLRVEYWAIRSSARSFARSLTHSLPSRDLRFHDLTIGPVPVRFHAISRGSGSGSGSDSYAKLIYYFSY